MELLLLLMLLLMLWSVSKEKRRWGPFAPVDKLLTRWELKKPSKK